MKTFFEMMKILEQDMEKNVEDKAIPQETPVPTETPETQPVDNTEIDMDKKDNVDNTETAGDLKHYMFFSNLKVMKSKIEEILSMDAHSIDDMLSDGHDWASDHISTSRDDVEEVYNWIVGVMK